MGLRDAVDALVASEPFGALLLARERPIVARAGASEAFVVAGVAVALEGPVLCVAPGPHEAEALADDLAAFLPGAVALLPAWEALPYEGISPSAEVAARRADAVRRLRAADGPSVVVAPALAAMHGVVPTLGTAAPAVVRAGAGVAFDELTARLVDLGYRRSDLVEHRGEFAVRGGIVDVFPGIAARPVRVEFDGDEVASIRDFSAATQLSTGERASASFDPVAELVPDDGLRARAAAAAGAHAGRLGDLLARMGDGLHPEGMETVAPLLFDHLPTPAELLPAGAWVVVTDVARTTARAGQAYADAAAMADSVAWPAAEVVRDLDGALAGRVRLHLTDYTAGLDLGIGSWATATANPPEMAARLAALGEDGHDLTITARGHGSLARVREVVGDVPAEAVESPLASGFVFGPGRLAVATEEDIFGTRRHTRGAPRFTARRADRAADDLEPGDHAVHRIHGVGRFLGVVHRELAGAERDYLVLEYAAGDKLYVPSDAVGMVARYIGGESPRVMRMGGSDWTRATAKVKRAVRDMAGELVRLYTVRMSVPGRAFGPDTPWQAELEDAFPHEETPDQLRVIDEVKADMERPVPMDRLLCGDVGFGKTEVAVRAAFKAVMAGTQVAVLVPTTLLAEQHYLTFTERFAPYPVSVRMLSRFVGDEEQAATVGALAGGTVDIVIGTHRLLGRDVGFRELGLLVVDEEQRFGVSHKERLKAMRARVD
ncbi:MAG TPA: DEAD/DEAH box helicase, partial [Actinomycetota bacterium]|nr:DEAD/DEAH box helicase [Actinomycetota bacterium]